jgi:FMN-dependent oxidoreductase (nitrilotriacetate monooxygenase family)
MAKEMILNAFETNAPGFMPPGQWTNPDDESFNYLTLEHWAKLARLLERGCFDGIFLADVLGMLDIYGGNADATLKAGAWTPSNDPMMLIPAMAQVTTHLGFGVTGNLSYEPPFLFARRMTTLDHLTGGRIGWNVVTGYLDSAARALGMAGQLPHDERYEAAEEYMDMMYRLWEGSWEDGAVVRDRENRVYADPEKVHVVRHHGKYYNMEAMHRCEPSPQRTPVLYQAGSSAKGRSFSSKHCECIFIAGTSKQDARRMSDDIRRQGAAQGRDPSDIKIIVDGIVIVGETEAEARRKLALHQKYLIPEGSLVMISAGMGVDLSKKDLDMPIGPVKSEGNQSATEALTRKGAEEVWTTRKIANHLHAARGAVIVGTPAQVADELQLWIEEAGIDGFNLSNGFRFRTMEDFVDMVVPELQKRGAFKKEYAPGTLREKLRGRPGARLPTSHPAAGYRRSGAAREAERVAGELG